jgi:hypothetical protein
MYQKLTKYQKNIPEKSTKNVQPAPPSTSCHHNTSKPIFEPKMCTNNLDNRDTNFSRPTPRQPANGRGRETVTGPTSPGAGGEKEERGEVQDTANWLEGSHAGRRERERDRHTPKKK